ncbi:MAG: prolipoprotein diacylglyceryl transferase, partial [Actinomycetaceae bacterium]|nr:prolipoprotein diacylglyceryl transferase [Actinomycetaceae bacterium]
PIRAYAIAILIGIALAVWILDRRYRAKGGPAEVSLDVAVWAVIFGILGARIYFVISTPDQYFGPGGDPLGVFRVWEGGLAIFGGLLGGALGIFIALRRRGLRFAPFVDALAPGLLVAQAVGRFGNYFNQELFGTPTTLPWALEIDEAHMPAGYAPGTTFHPTFLYEQIWNLLGAGVLVLLERKLRLRGGQVIASYFVIYGMGRFLIESIRTDFAHSFGGLRFNQWAALLAFIFGVVLLVVLHSIVRAHPAVGDVYLVGREPQDVVASDGTEVSDAVSASKRENADTEPAKAGSIRADSPGRGVS